MRFQPGCLISDQRVARGMALVQAIARELVDRIEQFVRFFGRDVVAAATLDEARALRVHFRLDLLAHRPPEQIGFAERVTGEHLRRLHHLFLVNEDAVGLAQQILEQWMRVSNLGPPILAVAEHRNVVHRAGSIERDEGNDVAERGRTDTRQRPPHAFGFELENTDCVAALEQLVDRRVVPRQRVKIDFDALLSEQPLGFLENGQRLQTEEVKLHQSRCLDIFHVELGDRHVRARISVERHELV